MALLALLWLGGCTFLAPLDGRFCEEAPCPTTTPDGGTPDTGTPDGGAPDAGPLSILYASRDPDPIVSQVKLALRIVNDGPEIELSRLAVRYHYSVDHDKPELFMCISVSSTAPPFDCDNLVGTLVPVGPTRRYLEITFKPAAKRVFPRGDTATMNLAFRASDYTDNDQTNDWSFDGSSEQQRRNERITLYRDGVLVWGKEP